MPKWLVVPGPAGSDAMGEWRHESYSELAAGHPAEAIELKNGCRTAEDGGFEPAPSSFGWGRI